MTDATVVTVVVPANDEAAVIGRCLDRLLDGLRPGEVDVLVVANGTTDATLPLAVRAGVRHGALVRTIDLPEPSKIVAVREGLRRAPGHVVVLDADIELSAAGFRALAAALDRPDPVIAAPTMRVDASRSSWPVRRYYRAWTALPYVTTSMVGSGVFALNEPGWRRLGDLPDVAHKYPSQISGGQQQRAAIARALANDPALIVGDEPTGNLDMVSAGIMFALFEDLVAQGKTIVMVTHDKDLAGQIPRVEEVRDGQLVAQSEIDQRLVAREESALQQHRDDPVRSSL